MRRQPEHAPASADRADQEKAVQEKAVRDEDVQKEQAEEETWRRPWGSTPGLEDDDEFRRLEELNPDDFE
ncbi:hypothetical protein [Nonomuraea cavernae]|uniref:hypothetical protein n=1 Tax=Nonomuraea cavernae TaxID=2045107 RepID=UPI003409E8C5